MSEEQHVKIRFRVEQDDDGYPGLDWETVRARVRSDGNFEIESIPWYVDGISWGDVVTARETQEGEWFFDALVVASANSTFRIYAADIEQATVLRREIDRFGAKCEGSIFRQWFAVHLPEKAPLRPLMDYLTAKRNEELLDLEWATMRHRADVA